MSNKVGDRLLISILVLTASFAVYGQRAVRVASTWALQSVC